MPLVNRRFTILLAFVALSGVFAGAPAHADAPAPKTATAKYEVRFMTGMIEHHAMAIMMAELCEDRAVHPELLALCEEIKAAQMAEMEQMQSWLQDWYGISYEPEMKPGMMRQMERLASLSGAEFEIEFMKMMIRHHWQAIVEARQCERRVYHAELRELCGDIIAAQSAEIAQMQDWLCEWYDVCNFGPKASHAHR